jgi:hypothetical protein
MHHLACYVHTCMGVFIQAEGEEKSAKCGASASKEVPAGVVQNTSAVCSILHSCLVHSTRALHQWGFRWSRLCFPHGSMVTWCLERVPWDCLDA